MPETTGNRENEPTILDPDQVAVIYDEKNGYSILLPHYDDQAEMPVQAAALVAAGMRLTDDEGFRDDLLHWLQERQNDMA